MTHHISRLPFLGDETLVSLPGIRGFDARRVVADSLAHDTWFTMAAVEPEFRTLLLDSSVVFESSIDPANVILGDIDAALEFEVWNQERRCGAGIFLGQLIEMVRRQPEGNRHGPLRMNMWGTAARIRERPDVVAIVRYWNPSEAVFTPAYGEPNYGPKLGFVLDAISNEKERVLKHVRQGMRILLPFF